MRHVYSYFFWLIPKNICPDENLNAMKLDNHSIHTMFNHNLSLKCHVSTSDTVLHAEG